MLGRLRKPALALTLGLCAFAWLVPAGEATRAPASARISSAPLLGGINVNFSYASSPGESARVIAEARALHARVIRIEIPWSAFEPLSPGQIEEGPVAATDRFVSDAAAAGIRVLMFVDKTPCWASSAPPAVLAGCSPSSQTEANVWPPTDPADYASFVAYLASRYGPHLAAIEIWNEPDQSNEFYFAGPEKAARYAAILRAAYTAVKQADPQVPVLAGSLVGSNGAFLRALYAAGIKGYYDGLAVHFYNLTLASLRSLHEVQLANGDHTPLWLDEFGWSSCWPAQKIQDELACVTPKVQAANILNAMHALEHSYVAAAVLYKLQDTPGDNFGVLSASGAHKPAFAALASALASPFGSVSRVTLQLTRKGGRVVASGSGPVGDFMHLEAFLGKVLRYRAIFKLDRFNDYSIALPSALGTQGLRVSVFQQWSGPARGAEKSI